MASHPRAARDRPQQESIKTGGSPLPVLRASLSRPSSAEVLDGNNDVDPFSRAPFHSRCPGLLPAPRRTESALATTWKPVDVDRVAGSTSSASESRHSVGASPCVLLAPAVPPLTRLRNGVLSGGLAEPLGAELRGPLQRLEVDELSENQRPQSADPDFWDVWALQSERDVDWPTIVADWSSP